MLHLKWQALHALLHKLLFYSHLYSNNFLNNLLSFPWRCLCWVLSHFEVRVLHARVNPEENFANLSCFWCFIIAKCVSIISYQYFDSFLYDVLIREAGANVVISPMILLVRPSHFLSFTSCQVNRDSKRPIFYEFVVSLFTCNAADQKIFLFNSHIFRNGLLSFY